MSDNSEDEDEGAELQDSDIDYDKEMAALEKQLQGMQDKIRKAAAKKAKK